MSQGPHPSNTQTKGNSCYCFSLVSFPWKPKLGRGWHTSQSLCDVNWGPGTREILLCPRVWRGAAGGPGPVFLRTPPRLGRSRESEVNCPNKWLLISSWGICKKRLSIVWGRWNRRPSYQILLVEIRIPMGNSVVISHCQYAVCIGFTSLVPTFKE